MVGLPCCQQSSSPRCQQNCQRVLTTLTSEEEILNGLISTCGQPLLGVRSSGSCLRSDIDSRGMLNFANYLIYNIIIVSLFAHIDTHLYQ